MKVSLDFLLVCVIGKKHGFLQCMPFEGYVDHILVAVSEVPYLLFPSFLLEVAGIQVRVELCQRFLSMIAISCITA